MNVSQTEEKKAIFKQFVDRFTVMLFHIRLETITGVAYVCGT